MPSPITPGAKFAKQLIAWNQNREGYAPGIEDYGLDRVADDEMIQRILSALFSLEGRGAYRSKRALQKKKGEKTPTPFPTATPPPGALDQGKGVLTGPTREQILQEQMNRYGI